MQFDGVSVLGLRNWLLELAGRDARAETREPTPLVDVSELLVQSGKDEQETQVERTLQRFVAGVDMADALTRQKEAVAMVLLLPATIAGSAASFGGTILTV